MTGLPIPEEKLAPLAPIPMLEEAILPVISDAICVPEPMELAMTPPDVSMEDLITTQSPVNTMPSVENRLSRSPEKKTETKKDKKDRDRDKDREKEPGRKKLRKDSDKEDSRNKMKDSSRSRKGKEQQPPMGVVVSESEPGKGPSGDDEVVVIGSRSAPQSRNQPNLREAAKAMPRIPKISQRHPSSSATGPSVPHSRDPRLMMLKSNQGESHNLSLLFFFLSLHSRCWTRS